MCGHTKASRDPAGSLLLWYSDSSAVSSDTNKPSCFGCIFCIDIYARHLAQHVWPYQGSKNDSSLGYCWLVSSQKSATLTYCEKVFKLVKIHHVFKRVLNTQRSFVLGMSSKGVFYVFELRKKYKARRHTWDVDISLLC